MIEFSVVPGPVEVIHRWLRAGDPVATRVKLTKGDVAAALAPNDATASPAFVEGGRLVRLVQDFVRGDARTPNAELARGLGARLADDGRLEVDLHQATSVPGLYAAGDVVHSLDQIAVAFGEAATAATAMHDCLNAEGWAAGDRARAGNVEHSPPDDQTMRKSG